MHNEGIHTIHDVRRMRAWCRRWPTRSGAASWPRASGCVVFIGSVRTVVLIIAISAMSQVKEDEKRKGPKKIKAEELQGVRAYIQLRMHVLHIFTVTAHQKPR